MSKVEVAQTTLVKLSLESMQLQGRRRDCGETVVLRGN